MWFACSNKEMMSYGLFKMIFFSAKRMGNIPFQTILEQALEHKMEVHEEHKFLHASCFL